MRRLYSHYAYIYPDIYLKNNIVVLNNQAKIVEFFSFEKEIEQTEFYSGILFFLFPDVLMDKALKDEVLNKINEGNCFSSTVLPQGEYVVYHDGISI